MFFKRLILIMALFFSYIVSPLNTFSVSKFMSKSYLEDNNIYIYNNYCNLDNKCNEIIKIDLRENSKFSKKYYNLDNLELNEKISMISNDFPKINYTKIKY